MNNRFDIFKRLPNGNTLWITTVEGLVEAKRRMGRLAAISGGEYFVYLQGEGIVAELDPSYQHRAEVARSGSKPARRDDLIVVPGAALTG